MLLLCQIISTICTLLVIILGAVNLITYRTHIFNNLTISMFYMFAMGGMMLSLPQIWNSIDNWFSLQWLIPNALVLDCSICYSWSQSLSFVLLCQRLHYADKESTIIRDNKKTNILLIVGITLVQCLFGVYIALLCKKYQNNLERKKLTFEVLELVCWAVDCLSQLVLLLSSLYTVKKLQQMFGDKFQNEINRMTVIFTIFGISFLVKTCFIWSMFIVHQ